MTDWERFKLWFSREEPTPEEIEQLQTDWIAENSDAREEGVFRDEYMRRIAMIKAAHEEDPFNPGKLLELAEAHAVIDPRSKECLKLIERLTSGGDMFFDKLRQGDTYQLLGRSLFLANRYEESLEAMLKAHACYRENGNRKLRRFNNVGLLRVYASLGNCKGSAERLEVALTQCEETDDSMLMYMHAKNALEKMGSKRDAEILDDIWYVFLDTHDQEKKQWENYQNMGDNVLRQCKPNDDDDQKNFAETIATFWPMLKRDLLNSYLFRGCIYAFMGSMVMYVLLLATVKMKGK